MASTGDLIAGRYRITTRLGRGGMGTVWRAKDELLGRDVAVKELHVDDELALVDAELQRERTLREARTVAQVRHPNIMVLHDIVSHDAQPWIVMELIDGRSLADLIAAEGPLTPAEAGRIGLDLLAALGAAHDSGVQHRDLKPANVMLEAGTGRVVLSDFGIAQVVGQPTLTETGAFVGSPEYTAPERMSGKRTGPESDLWSLGVLLCTAVTGESPFHRDSLAGVLHAVVMDEIQLPPAAGPLLPVIRGLLERHPDVRLDAPEAAHLLRTVLTDSRSASTVRRPLGETKAEHPDGFGPGHTDAHSGAAHSGAAHSGAARSGATTTPDTPHPPADPLVHVGPTTATPARRPRVRAALLGGILVAVLAAGGAGAGVWLLTRDDGSSDKTTSNGTSDQVSQEDLPDQPEGGRVPPPAGGKSGKPTPSTDATDPDGSGSGDSEGATSGTGDATEDPQDSGPPSYHTVNDQLGFELAVPDGFTRSSEPPRVFYYSPGKTYRLGVHPQPQDPDGPLAVMQRAHEDGPSRYPGYRLGSVREITHNGQPAALWEFTWDGTSADGGPRHTYDLSWDENGKMHDVWLSAPTTQEERGKQYFDKAIETFVAPPAD